MGRGKGRRKKENKDTSWEGEKKIAKRIVSLTDRRREEGIDW